MCESDAVQPSVDLSLPEVTGAGRVREVLRSQIATKHESPSSLASFVFERALNLVALHSTRNLLC